MPHEMLPEVPAAPEPTRSGDAPVNDIRMHYATYGGGRPILLLHGGLGHSEYWFATVVSDGGFAVGGTELSRLVLGL